MGLPRPYAVYPVPNRLNIAAKTPIPWQSNPDLEISGGITLNQENENKVWVEKRCAYCGAVFSDDEKAIRWTKLDKPLHHTYERVFSDLHPFHLECMKETRIFCPFMRKTKDSEYETGKYSNLRANAHAQISTTRF